MNAQSDECLDSLSSDPIGVELLWLQLTIAAELARIGQDTPQDARSPVTPRLVAELSGTPTPAGSEQLRRRAKHLRAKIRAAKASPDNGLGRVCTAFRLDEVDRQLLVVVAAADLDARFGYLYGLVLGDSTRRYASEELACRLLAETTAGERRVWQRLAPGSRLRRAELILDEPGDPFPFRRLHVPDPITHMLMSGEPVLDPALTSFARLVFPQSASDLWTATYDSVLGPRLLDQIRQIVGIWNDPGSGGPPALLLAATYAALAEPVLSVLARLSNRPRIEVDLDALVTGPGSMHDATLLLVRDASIARAMIVLFSPNAPETPDPATARSVAAVIRAAEQSTVPLVLCWSQSPPPCRPSRFLRVDVSTPDTATRARLWRVALDGKGLSVAESAVQDLADMFVLGGDDIAIAVDNAFLSRLLAPGSALPCELRSAADARSLHRLDGIARRIEPSATWDDLVVPAPVTAQLREVAAAARHRHRVLEDWGLGRRTRGSGVSALFRGRSGTGKTTAAEVLANDLGVALYAVDLATVISKWVGETEKNLRRVFEAARNASAVVLFDEAEALFGSRSQVKDSHDRYANTEVAYLLQLMESFDGVAVLATNLAGNMDTAFLRRLRYAVEFPVPDAALRSRLWRLALPTSAPLRDLDLDTIAARFDLTGGDIHNAALHAASLAAASGGELGMAQVMIGVAREYQKLQRVVGPADFGAWYPDVAAHLHGVNGSADPCDRTAAPDRRIHAGSQP